jgi:hypothetical protein
LCVRRHDPAVVASRRPSQVRSVFNGSRDAAHPIKILREILGMLGPVIQSITTILAGLDMSDSNNDERDKVGIR